MRVTESFPTIARRRGEHMPPPDADLARLIAQLDTDDQQRRKRAGAALLAAGRAATPHLVEALRSPAPRIRQSAAFLLGRLKPTPAGTEALERAVVTDPDAKVRKNAAVALGAHGSPTSIDALTAALEQESVRWVRPSLILALGAIGGPQAAERLQEIEPQTEPEREALLRASAHVSALPQLAAWRSGPWRPQVLFDVPAGLEHVAAAEAHERGFGRWEQVGEGRLACPDQIDPAQAAAQLRCTRGMLIPGGVGPPLPLDRPDECASAVAALLSASPPLRRWREWLQVDGDVLRFRITLAQQAPRQTHRAVVAAARAACQPLMLQDSPSSYAVELLVETSPASSQLIIRPTGIPDTRFAYRLRDVPAAINPVIAACLARLARTGPGATVLDPTCGSATLLIERALAGEAAALLGFDRSLNAVAAAQANIAAAGLQGRIRVVEADALGRGGWLSCDEVLANLPFGVRTRSDAAGLQRLYEGILARIGQHLRPGGRAVLYTAQRRLMEQALHQHRAQLQILDQLRTSSGGLVVHIWVIGRRGGR